MYKLDLIIRHKKINRNLYVFNKNTKDIVCVLQIGLKKRVIEKLGYIDPLSGRSNINFLRLSYILAHYPGIRVSHKFGLF